MLEVNHYCKSDFEREKHINSTRMLELRHVILRLRESHLNSVSLSFLFCKKEITNMCFTYISGLFWGWSERYFVRLLNYKNYLSCLFKKYIYLLPRFLCFPENWVLQSPLLCWGWGGDIFQDPQWTPEITDNTEPCFFFLFLYTPIFSLKGST